MKVAIGIQACRIDKRARWQQKREGPKRVVRVLNHSATHAAGVVGDNAAHAATTDGGRIGADFRAV